MDTFEERNQQDTFEQHDQRMRMFRKSHELIRYANYLRAESLKQASPPTDLQKLLPSLMKIGYLLSLVKERDSVLLPKNWQN